MNRSFSNQDVLRFITRNSDRKNLNTCCWPPPSRRRTMRYICLGYIERGKVEGMTDVERNAMLDECFEHNDHARQRTSYCRITSSASGNRHDPVLENRQRRDHRETSAET